MTSIQELMSVQYLDNSLLQYATAGGMLLAGLGLLFLVERVVLRRLEAWAARTPSQLDDVVVGLVRKAFFPLLTVGAVTLSLRGLHLHKTFQSLISLSWMGLLTFFCAGALLSLA